MSLPQGDRNGGRPEIFSSAWAEFIFCFSIVMSQIMSEYFISGFFVSLPTIVRSLDIPEAATTWPASAFTLTAGAALLIFGRLADMYGPQRVYLVGLAWYAIWSLISGFAVNQIMLDVARAMQGFGPAAFLTSGVALLGTVYKPGKRKNIVFAIYGGTAPIGFFLGIILGGTTSQNLTWRWYFWIGTILNAVAFGGGLCSIPWNFNAHLKSDIEMSSLDKQESIERPEMDYCGAILFFVGLFLITFSLTDSAHAPNGWLTPYVPALFIVGWLILIACIIFEAKFAKQPLLPLRILKLPQMPWFMLTQFLTFGAFGIWLFYITVYVQNVLHVSPLDVVAWFVPFGIGGLIISILGGLFLDKIAGSILLGLVSVAWIVATLLLAIAPVDASYWPWIFPAMICGTLGIDTAYIVASVFLTSSLSENEQGLAGALFNSLQFLGISIWLGFADITASQYAYRGLRGSYQTAFWLGLGCAGAALVIGTLFVRIGRAKSAEEQEDTIDSSNPPKMDEANGVERLDSIQTLSEPQDERKGSEEKV